MKSLRRVLALFACSSLLAILPATQAEVIYWPTALDLAKQRAASVKCVNNLNQILLAAETWSYDHANNFPSSFQTFSNYLASPAVLFCPADLSRSAVTNWTNFDWSQIGYQWLPQPNWNNPEAVCCRCLVHENCLFVGGYAQITNSYRTGWPAIVAPPIAQDATPGSALRFEVRVASNTIPPIAYQWRREQLYFVTNVTFMNDVNGGHYVTNRASAFGITNLVGQTNPVYLINAAQPNVSDYYSVTVSNSLGMTASSEVRLGVDATNSVVAGSDYWSAVNCLNNLKAIGLFIQLWSQDHGDRLPHSFSEMTNSLGRPIFGWPTVLFCRADKLRTAPADWPGLSFADTSYELLPGDDQDYSRIVCRCKVHGLYLLGDGTAPSLPMFWKTRRLGGNLTELTLLLLSSKTNTLEASSNLLDWTALTNYSGVSGTFSFYETNSTPHRFYRIRLP
jgi:hypothetical protein